MNLDLRKFNFSTELQAQRELFKDCFPENLGTSVESTEHYNWKFQSYPASPPSYEYGAWDKDSNRLVGYYAALPYRYQVGNTLMTSGMVCDVMTHSLARGKGIFTKLGKFSTDQLKEQGLDFTTGYPIRKEVIPGHLKVGWKVAFELPLYLKVLKSKALLGKFRLGAFAPVVDLGLGCLRLLTRECRSSSNLTVKILNTDIFFREYKDLFEAFFNEWKEDKPIHLIKDRDFLQWRLSAPESDYKIVAVMKEKKLSALCITREKLLDGVPSLAILDLMILENARDTVGPLFKTLEQVALESKLETIAVMCSKTWASSYKFLRFGFIKSHLSFKLILKPLSERANTAPLWDEKNWHLMWIDCDDL